MPFAIGRSSLSLIADGDGHDDGHAGDTSFEDFQRYIDFRD